MSFDDAPIDRGDPQATARADAYARAVRAKCLADLDDWTRRLMQAAEALNGRRRAGARADGEASARFDG
jgi:hypothetical protein